MSVFEDLNGLNINGHTEEKMVSGTKLTYLSWPWAWAEVKKRYPDAHYDIWKNERNLPYTYDPLTGFMVYTSVTIDGITHEMWLPVMDGANKAMKAEPYEYATKYGKKCVEAASMMDINKTIMRCLVKNLAMFGLGLYIYAGEDLPETEKESAPQNNVPGEMPAGTLQEKVNRAARGAAVNKVDKVPAPAGNAPETAKKPETPGAYLQRKIAEMKAMYPKFDFIGTRKALIESGTVKDVPSATMTMDQAVQLAAAVNDVYAAETPKVS